MPTISETIERIVNAAEWNQRIAQIRLIPQHHGTGEHVGIFASVARTLYLPHLAPDFAYVHEAEFYGRAHFQTAYDAASAATHGFDHVDELTLTQTLIDQPRSLLVFRTMLGLTRDEFAHSTTIAGEAAGLVALSAAKVDSMERNGSATKPAQASVAARTIMMVMDGTLFGESPPGLISKQKKPDTEDGWASARAFAQGGVPYSLFLHQRHYGGAFRQILDATSTLRGDLIEDAVEALFVEHRVPFIPNREP